MSIDFDRYVTDLFASTEELWTLEKYGAMVHQSAWPDIVAKAKRLIQNGQVQILRNAPEHVWGYVIGDHGEYNTELSRTDPNSQIIETWQCDCPWDQFAFNRTREWKKFEGRVCSHVLATYWRAMGVPLDAGYDEQQGKSFQKQGPPQQRIPAPMVHPAPEPGQSEVQRLQELRERSMERDRNGVPLLPGENEQMQFEPMAPTQQGEQKPLLPQYPRPWEGPPPSDQDLLFGEQPESPYRYPEAPSMQRQDFDTFDTSKPWTPTPVPPENQLSIFQGDPPDPADPFSGIGFSSIPYGTKRIFDSWWGKPYHAVVADSALTFEMEGPHEPPADDYQTGKGEGYTITAFNPDHDPIGSISFNVEPDQVFVSWVETEPNYRRQGVGSALVREVERRYPGLPLETSGLTEDGEEFWPHVASNWYEDPDKADWQHGLCADYAMALLGMYPHLRMGTLVDPESYVEQHFFGHDDKYAYDSLGRHPLPYTGFGENTGQFEQRLDDSPSDYNYTPGEPAEGLDEDFERAKALIAQQHPWLAGRTAATGADDFLTWYQNCKEQGRHPAAQVVSRDVYLEARGGKQPRDDAEPSGHFPDGTPRYRMMDLGYDPATGERVRSTEGGEWGPGAPEQRDVMMEVPVNSRCEVIDVEPLLKMAYIIVPTNDSFGRLEASNLVGWVWFTDLRPLDEGRNVFIRRR